MNDINLLASLRFHGARFQGHKLDVDCVNELPAYKELVVECAKVLWTRNHPDRERLPRGFEDDLILNFDTLLEGSAVVPLKRARPEIEVGTSAAMNFDEYDEFDEAAELIDLAIEAASKDQLLPDVFPKNVIPLFGKFGKSLKADEVLYLQSRKRQSEAAYTAGARKRLSEWTESTYQDRVDLIGEVSMANTRGGTFELAVYGQQPIKGKFSSELEAEILEALKQHKTSRLRVIGTGEFSSSDRILRKFINVETASIAVLEEHTYANVKPIWEIVAGIGESLPEDSWKNVPSDLSKNIDDYLYSGK